MALAFLTLSVLLQAWAVVQAVRLARRRNRSGWVFFVTALVVMFSRRAFSLYGALELQHPGDPVAELLALVISVLLVMGLSSLTRHGSEPALPLASEAPATKAAVERLERPALGLAILALAGASSLIYFAYTASQDAISEQLNRGNLRLAQLLGTNAAAARAGGRDPLREIAVLWESQRHEPNDEYVTVLREDGRLLLHSREPARVGSLASSDPPPAAARAVNPSEVAGSRKDWVGRSLDTHGEPELVAQAYAPALAAMISVHVPALGVDAKIRAAAMPWALGFAATLMIVFPLSLGLLYRANSASQAAAARAAETQRQMEDRHRKIVETTHEGVWLVDAQARTTFVNQRLATMFHCSVGEMLGRSIYDFLDDEAKQQAAAGLARRRQGIAEVYELRFRRLDGSELWTFLSTSPVQDESGNYQGSLAMVSDVTERRALEEKLRQTQKMEAIGLLAGGVAHDFNNLLTVIQGNAALLRESGNASGEEELDAIEHAAARAAELTRQLLTFGRKQALQRRPVDLSQSVRHVLQMLDRILGEDIEVATELERDLPAIHADGGMLEQVIVNLAVNARDAMAAGGQLRISTAARTLDSAAAAASAEGRSGRYVCLSVSDTGTGIEARHLPQIFEPFFTTKEVGKGTGLGLATVYAIARQHDGWVSVETGLGVGTTFHVWFPASPAASAALDPRSAEPVAGVSQRRELILVVEDDAKVRALVERVLLSTGYRVLLAESSVAALEMWIQHRDEIQLLLTDLVMPGGMTGQQLADRLWLDRPELDVLFTSGYSAELPKRNDLPGELVHFLAKPYHPRDLARAVQQCLRARAAQVRTPAA